MPHRLLPTVLVFLPLMFSHSAGCGGKPSGPEKFEVFGKVTHNGRPIDDGEISFQPEQGTSGPPSSGTIKNGAYRLSDTWGLAAGTYQVKIVAYRAPPPGESNLIPPANPGEVIQPGGELDQPPAPPHMPRRDQFLPAKFNEESTIEKLVVSTGQKKIEKNYELKD